MASVLEETASALASCVRTARASAVAAAESTRYRRAAGASAGRGTAPDEEDEVLGAPPLGPPRTPSSAPSASRSRAMTTDIQSGCNDATGASPAAPTSPPLFWSSVSLARCAVSCTRCTSSSVRTKVSSASGSASSGAAMSCDRRERGRRVACSSGWWRPLLRREPRAQGSPGTGGMPQQTAAKMAGLETCKGEHGDASNTHAPSSHSTHLCASHCMRNLCDRSLECR